MFAGFSSRSLLATRGQVNDVVYKGLSCTLAAGLAWGIPLPAWNILTTLSGSWRRRSKRADHFFLSTCRKRPVNITIYGVVEQMN